LNGFLELLIRRFAVGARVGIARLLLLFLVGQSLGEIREFGELLQELLLVQRQQGFLVCQQFDGLAEFGIFGLDGRQGLGSRGRGRGGGLRDRENTTGKPKEKEMKIRR
jgi:hypothetical protein